MITVLLDVDGVLNASGAGWSRAPRSGNAYVEGNSYRMRWEPEVMKRITDLSNRPDTQVLWATSWVGYTRQLEILFKLPALLSAGSKAMSIAMKRQAALDVLKDPEARLIWIDDEAIPWTGPLYDDPDRVLLIEPKSNKGLRPEHFDSIQVFLDKQAAMS